MPWVLLSEDGLAEVRHHLAAMTPDDVHPTTPEFADVATQAGKAIIAPHGGGGTESRAPTSR